MPDVTTFAGLFGAVFPAESEVETGVVYGPLGDDLLGTLEGGLPAPDPPRCNLAVSVIDQSGDPIEGIRVIARLPTGSEVIGDSIGINLVKRETTDSNGTANLVLLRDTDYELLFRRPNGTTAKIRIKTGITSSQTLSQVYQG
jgi:hypothetical protein